jgi:hypothetical protein
MPTRWQLPRHPPPRPMRWSLTDVPESKEPTEPYALADTRTDPSTRKAKDYLGDAAKLNACRDALLRRQARAHPASQPQRCCRSLLDSSQRRNGVMVANLASIQAAENKLLLNTYERNPYLL